MENDEALFQDPTYLQALMRAGAPIVALPNGGACKALREYCGVSQKLAATICSVGINSVQRWESGAVTHSRSLEHQPYTSLLAAFLTVMYRPGAQRLSSTSPASGSAGLVTASPLATAAACEGSSW
jgi:hypothetical protein